MQFLRAGGGRRRSNSSASSFLFAKDWVLAFSSATSAAWSAASAASIIASACFFLSSYRHLLLLQDVLLLHHKRQLFASLCDRKLVNLCWRLKLHQVDGLVADVKVKRDRVVLLLRIVLLMIGTSVGSIFFALLRAVAEPDGPPVPTALLRAGGCFPDDFLALRLLRRMLRANSTEARGSKCSPGRWHDRDDVWVGRHGGKVVSSNWDGKGAPRGAGPALRRVEVVQPSSTQLNSVRSG